MLARSAATYTSLHKNGRFTTGEQICLAAPTLAWGKMKTKTHLQWGSFVSLRLLCLGENENKDPPTMPLQK